MNLSSTHWILGITAAAVTSISALTASAAPVERGRPVSVQMVYAGKNIQGSAVLQQQMTTRVDLVDIKWQWVRNYVPVSLCTAPGRGDGTHGDWKMYFDITAHTPYDFYARASALSRAIMGIDSRLAMSIVQNQRGFLPAIPPNWDAFRSEILRMEQQYQLGFSYDVLVRFGRQNMENLGYASSTDPTCPMGTDIRDSYELAEYIAASRVATKDVRIEIVNAPLLKLEGEQIQINYDGFKDSMTITQNYNLYSVARTDMGSSVVYKLTGTRRQITPANNLQAQPMNQNGKYVVNVTDAAYDPDMGAEMGDAFVIYQVWEAKTFKDKKISEGKVAISQGHAVIDENRMPKDMKVYTKYAIQRVGSKYHSADPSELKKTESIKFK